MRRRRWNRSGNDIANEWKIATLYQVNGVTMKWDGEGGNWKVVQGTVELIKIRSVLLLLLNLFFADNSMASYFNSHQVANKMLRVTRDEGG